MRATHARVYFPYLAAACHCSCMTDSLSFNCAYKYRHCLLQYKICNQESIFGLLFTLTQNHFLWKLIAKTSQSPFFHVVHYFLYRFISEFNRDFTIYNPDIKPEKEASFSFIAKPQELQRLVFRKLVLIGLSL